MFISYNLRTKFSYSYTYWELAICYGIIQNVKFTLKYCKFDFKTRDFNEDTSKGES